MRNDFDYTMMSTYQICQRRYYYRHVEGLVPKRRATPLEFGGWIHKALDEWFVSKDPDKAVEVFNSGYKEDLEADDKRTNKLGEWIIRNYHETYKDQPMELVAGEREFTQKLPNGNNLIGRIDKIVKWNGGLWLMDHKTTSSLGAQFFKMAEPNMQFTGYAWAAKQLGYEVIGVLLDAVLVAKGLLNSSQRARLTPCARYDVYLNQWQFDEFLNTVGQVQGDIRLSEESGRWLPNHSMCTYYGECPYRKLCMEEESIRKRVIPQFYDVDHWDPRDEKGD